MRRKYINEPIDNIKKNIEKQRAPLILGPFKEDAADSGGEVWGLGSSSRPNIAPVAPSNLLAEQLGGELMALAHTTIARAKQEEDRVKELAGTVSIISRQVKVLRNLQTRLDAAPV